MAKLTIVFAILCSLIFIGCDGHSGSDDPTTQEFNAGEQIYAQVEEEVQASEYGAQKVEILRSESKLYDYVTGTHREKIILALNSIFEGMDLSASATRLSEIQNLNREETLRILYDLIDDGVLPELTNACTAFIDQIQRDEVAISCLRSYLATRNGSDIRNMIVLMRKVLDYPKCKELFVALATILNQDTSSIKQILRILSSMLKELPATPETAKFLGALTQELKFQQKREPIAWMARLDENDNPKVLVDPKTNKLYAPFVEGENGNCKVQADKIPVDKNGNLLDISAFGYKKYIDENGKTLIVRDKGRAVTVDGEPIFHYYNVKNTLLAFIMHNAGKAMQQKLLVDLYYLINKGFETEVYTSNGVSYEGYSKDAHLLKALLGVLQLGKSPLTKIFLKSCITLHQKDPEGMKSLIVGIVKLLFVIRDDPRFSSPEEIEKNLSNTIMTIPEMMRAMQGMGEITTEFNSMNMAMFFITWVGQNAHHLSYNVFWEFKLALKRIQSAAVQDPQFVEHLFGKFVQWFYGKDASETENSPVRFMPEILGMGYKALEGDPQVIAQKIDVLCAKVQGLICHKDFRYLTKDVSYLQQKEFKEIHQFLVYCLIPQEVAYLDVYGELARIGVGMIEHQGEIQAKVKLLNIIGALINPDQAIMKNLLEILRRFMSIENSEGIFNSLKVSVNQCEKYKVCPLAIFTQATMEVLRVGTKPKYKSQITNQHVRILLGQFRYFLNNDQGIIQRLYRIILSRKSK